MYSVTDPGETTYVKPWKYPQQQNCVHEETSLTSGMDLKKVTPVTCQAQGLIPNWNSEASEAEQKNDFIHSALYKKVLNGWQAFSFIQSSELYTVTSSAKKGGTNTSIDSIHARIDLQRCLVLSTESIFWDRSTGLAWYRDVSSWRLHVRASARCYSWTAVWASSIPPSPQHTHTHV